MKRLFLFLLMTASAWASADLIHCRFEPIWRPITYLRYDTKKRIVWTQSGFPQQWRRYTNVELFTGLPPYLNKGISLVTSGNVPIIHLRETGNATLPMERELTYPWEAVWGNVPGGPEKNPKNGVCWSDKKPAKNQDSNR